MHGVSGRKSVFSFSRNGNAVPQPVDLLAIRTCLIDELFHQMGRHDGDGQRQKDLIGFTEVLLLARRRLAEATRASSQRMPEAP
jgi:hypothetical protein